MTAFLAVPLFASLWMSPAVRADDKAAAAPAAAGKASRGFNELADQALAAMTKRAEELHIKGVALVARIEGDQVRGWSSKMTVVGSMKNAPSGTDRGANLLAIAYAKAAEMAETLKDSGHAGRPPMVGELGYKGGAVAKVAGGYVLAAFSGGPSSDDYKVSQAGLQVLSGQP